MKAATTPDALASSTYLSSKSPPQIQPTSVLLLQHYLTEIDVFSSHVCSAKMSQRSKSGNTASDIPMLPPLSLSGSQEQNARQRPVRERDQVDGPSKPVPGQPTSHESHGHNPVPRHRFLSSAEWSVVAIGMGAVSDAESHKPAHPKRWLWPPAGMPRGLYRDVVANKYKYFYLFHVTSVLRGSLMILQLLVGATLTALGSMSLEDGTPITVLAAVNTVLAGILALLHNSGLPDRYRNDMVEFEELEDHIKEVLDSSIAPVGQTTDQILAECFDRFRDAKATVATNMPANYTSTQNDPAPNQIPSEPLPSGGASQNAKPAAVDTHQIGECSKSKGATNDKAAK